MKPNVNVEETAVTPDGEMTELETQSIAAGRFTNIRANASALSGGSAAGATPVIA